MENKVPASRIEKLLDSCDQRFHHFEGTTLTVCSLFLPDGFFLAMGESCCVDPKNFEERVGRRYAAAKARRAAIDKLWELEGYALKQRLNEVAD